MGVPAIEFDNVSFAYPGGGPVVVGVSFAVEQGDFFALLGPNGGGKTTLVKLALGLLRPIGGRLRLFGEDLDKFKEWRRIGYVPQRAVGFEGRFPATVSEVVAQGSYTGIQPLAFFRPTLTDAVAEALRFVGLWDYRAQRITDLSRGQQQRVLIARALVQQRDLLMLDEPTAGVDGAGQQSFYDLLEELHQQRGLTILLVSHDVGVVLRYATRCSGVCCNLVFHGSPEDLREEDLTELYQTPVGLLSHQHS